MKTKIKKIKTTPGTVNPAAAPRSAATLSTCRGSINNSVILALESRQVAAERAGDYAQARARKLRRLDKTIASCVDAGDEE